MSQTRKSSGLSEMDELEAMYNFDIAFLERENKRLKQELELLRGNSQCKRALGGLT